MKSQFAALLVVILLAPSTLYSDDAQRPLPIIGADYLVLVDCSGSMTRLQDRKWGSGSDPYQLRWDAVKLFVDLLGPEDRVMIRRFSSFLYPLPEPTESGNDRKLDELRVWLYGDGGKNLNGLTRRNRARGDVPAYMPEREFAEDMQFLSPPNRKRLYEKIDYFNFIDDTRDSNENLGLDGGGTSILASLKELGPRLVRQSARSIHVVLLTDGLDDGLRDLQLSDGDDRYEQMLKTHLNAYLGGGAGESRIAIHTFGLGLKERTNENARALQLLKDLSFRTGGEPPKLVDDSVQIIHAFRKLVQKLKGCYLQDISSSTQEVETMLVSGIVDLGVISYAETTGTSPKEMSRPFLDDIRFEWKGLKENNLSKPADEQRRTEYGKGKSQYRYDYFGPAYHADSAIGESPFAEFRKPVFLVIPFPREPDPQTIHILKRTPDLFELISPAPGSTFSRFKVLNILVRMKKNSFFGPEKFTLMARIRQSAFLADEKVGDENSILLVPTLCEDHSGDTVFTGSIPLTQLASSDTLRNEYIVAVRIEGNKTPLHGLSGTNRELPERTFAVNNKLSIHELAHVRLTTEFPKQELAVEVDADGDTPILLDFRFTPPKIGSGSLSVDDFEVAAAPVDGITADLSTQVPLHKGKGTISIAMKDQSAVKYGLVYAPGSLIVSHGTGALESSASTTVGLRLDRSELELTPNPRKSTLKPGEHTELLTLNAATHPANASLNLEIVALQPENQPFSETELWIEKEQKPEVEAAARHQSLAIGPGQPFRICFSPEETKNRSGKHAVKLKASSEWSDDFIDTLFLDVEAPEIVVSDAMTAYARPGDKLTVSVQSHLENPSVASELVFVSNQPSEDVKFLRSEESGKVGSAVINMHFPRESNPVQLSTMDRQIDFELEVPNTIDYGQYEARLVLSGKDLIDQEIVIRLVVNDILFSVSGTETAWDDVSRHLQVVDHDGLREIWIATGIREAILPEDLELHFLPPFHDDAHSLEPELPIVKSVTAVMEIPGVPKSPGLRVEIRFPAEGNPNSDGNPYKVKLNAISARHHLERLFDFEVQYLRKQEIIELKVYQSAAPGASKLPDDVRD